MSTSKQLKRIIADLEPFINPSKIADKPDNIFVSKCDDITKLKIVIFGPDDTPYEGGIFFFSLTFPPKYPFEPPQIKLETIDNHVRFNPNLYAEGKVCLSILGTWTGPPWKPTLNLASVLLSIQSLMSEHPIINEPSHESINKNDIRATKYNKYIRYHTIRLAIIEVLNGRYPEYMCFKEEYEKYFRSKHVKLTK
jgi:ubiquitin-conjugating enzyme E2 Z